MRFLYFLVFLLTSLTGFCEAPQPRADEHSKFLFEIEDSSCFVGIARVYLSVSSLKVEDGHLVGTYTIRVPLKKSKNDRGKIIFPWDEDDSGIWENGGVLTGRALSDIDANVENLVVGEVLPYENQAIRLKIVTSNRTLNFRSRFRVVSAEP